MKRTVFATVAVAGLLASCATQPKSAGMVEFEKSRAQSEAEVVKQRFPDLYQEAEVHHAKATEAHKDKEQEAMEHHSKVAMLWWNAAKTSSQTVDLHEKTAAYKSDLDAAELELAEVQKRNKDAEAAVARLNEIVALESKLGSSEKSNAARKALNAALAMIKEAEAVNARKHAAEKFSEAETKFESATDALEGGDVDKAESMAIEAKVAAEAAKAASGDQYASEKAQLAYQERRRALFDATASVPGLERSITDGGVTLTMRQVFPSGKVEIDRDRIDALNRLAGIANDYKDFSLVIEGHTDTKGSDSRNLSLSESRAKAVMSYLAQQGVSPGRMTAVGKGEGEPVAENTSKAGRAQNRRIEILFAQGSAPK